MLENIRLILVGDASTGKSSIMQTYSDGIFPEDYQATIGIEYCSKIIKINKKEIKLNVWDTSGQERFRAITISYYRGSHGIIFVYDVCDRQSFENIKTIWFANIGKYISTPYKCILVANKIDKSNNRIVSTSEGKTLAEEINATYLEVSAKAKHNIDKLFTDLTTIIVSDKQQIDDQDKIESVKLPYVESTQSIFRRFCTIL